MRPRARDAEAVVRKLKIRMNKNDRSAAEIPGPVVERLYRWRSSAVT